MPSIERPFGELFGEPTRNGLNRPKAVRGSGAKMVNMGELFAFPRLRNAPMDRAPLSDEEAKKSLLRGGDLLFARQSLVADGAGKCSIFLGDDEPVTFESHVTRVRLNGELANPEYYFYYFQSPQGRARIRSIVELGAGAAGIRGSDLYALQVPWRDVNEQAEIAAILSSLDAQIELNRRMNATLEALARAIFESWFVRFDPVRAKLGGEPAESIGRRLSLTPELLALFPDRLVASELGQIPDGWQAGTIADQCELNALSWASKTLPAHVHYLDLANAKEGVVSEIQVFAASDAPTRARRILRVGDTIIGAVRPGNRSYALIGPSAVQLTGSTGFAVLTPKRGALREMVYLWATSESNIGRLSRLADGAAYPAVRPELVVAGPSIVPAPEIIDAFHEIVSPLIDRQLANRASSESLAAIRDTLLAKLMSGDLANG